MNQTLPSTAVAAAPRRPQIALMNPAMFDQMQRVGKMLAMSPLFPEHLRRGSPETAIANGVLVLNMAIRLEEDPLTVAQNIYFVGGKPGWSSSYLISKANQHGVFAAPIEWETTGAGDALSVTAFAIMKKSGNRVSVTCDMKLARAEGWTNNKKYMSMPGQMLRYRSATWLIRLYCPEVMVGVPATIDNDLGSSARNVTPDDYGPEAIISAHGEVIEAVAEVKPVVQESKVEKVAPKEDETSAPAAAQQEKPAAETAQAAEAAPTREFLENIRTSIVNDMLDSMMPSAVTDFYADQVVLLKTHAADLFEEVQATIAEITKRNEEKAE